MLPRPPPAQTVGDQGHIARFALVGPTATGKSALALALARARGDVELISADSMCVYRGMDIGTAKPGPEDQRAGRYHLIDVVEANEDYSVRRFQTAARDAMAEIEGRGHVVVVVGGTGLYTRAVVDDFEIPGRWPEVATSLRRQLEEGGSRAGALLYQRLAELDPTAASRLEASNTRRLVRALEVTLGSGRPFSSFGPGMVAYPSTGFTIIGIDLPDEVLDARIRARFEHQMDRGFVAETAALIDRAGGLSATARQALGYREILTHLEDGVELSQCVESALARIRKFARRQRSWFRRDPRTIWLGEDLVQQGGQALTEAVLKAAGEACLAR